MDCTLCQIIVTFQRKTFRKNIKTIKTIYENIRYEKLQNDINREAAIISSLSSGEIEKYEYLSGKLISPSDQSTVIEQAKFSYSPLEKAFEKQIKPIESQVEKQIKTLEERGKQLVT